MNKRMMTLQEVYNTRAETIMNGLTDMIQDGLITVTLANGITPHTNFIQIKAGNDVEGMAVKFTDDDCMIEIVTSEYYFLETLYYDEFVCIDMR